MWPAGPLAARVASRARRGIHVALGRAAERTRLGLDRDRHDDDALDTERMPRSLYRGERRRLLPSLRTLKEAFGDQERRVVVDRAVGQQHPARDQGPPAARRVVAEVARPGPQRGLVLVDQLHPQPQRRERRRPPAPALVPRPIAASSTGVAASTARAAAASSSSSGTISSRSGGAPSAGDDREAALARARVEAQDGHGAAARRLDRDGQDEAAGVRVERRSPSARRAGTARARGPARRSRRLQLDRVEAARRRARRTGRGTAALGQSRRTRALAGAGSRAAAIGRPPSTSIAATSSPARIELLVGPGQERRTRSSRRGTDCARATGTKSAGDGPLPSAASWSRASCSTWVQVGADLRVVRGLAVRLQADAGRRCVDVAHRLVEEGRERAQLLALGAATGRSPRRRDRRALWRARCSRCGSARALGSGATACACSWLICALSWPMRKNAVRT